ncbi:MAG: sugar transferase [Acidimicrobiales bacterium]
MLTRRPDYVPVHLALAGHDMAMGSTTDARRQTDPRRLQLAGKRGMDITLSAIALLVLLPVIVVLALVVRLGSPGPVLFRQRRAGLDGREFTMLKFRSMVDGADKLRGLLEEANEADGLLFKVADDPRITGIGSWLRRYSLDEVPQLFNVLRGEMSLVGPRPALPSEVAAYDTRTAGRLKAKPGLTGPWQVSDRHLSSFEDYVRLDLDYVDGWSLAGDLDLMVRTIPAVLLSTGA